MQDICSAARSAQLEVLASDDIKDMLPQPYRVKNRAPQDPLPYRTLAEYYDNFPNSKHDRGWRPGTVVLDEGARTSLKGRLDPTPRTVPRHNVRLPTSGDIGARREVPPKKEPLKREPRV